MNTIALLEASNLVQICATFACGILCFAVYSFVTHHQLPTAAGTERLRFQGDVVVGHLISAFGIFSSAIIGFCFLFDLGETYNYSAWYKRSFGPFGDGFPFALILPLTYAYHRRSFYLFALTLTALVLAGGRMVLLFALIAVLFQAVVNKRTDPWHYILKGGVIALCAYFVLVFISNFEFASLKIGVQEEIEDVANQPGSSMIPLIKELVPVKPVSGRVCETAKNCIRTQVSWPLRQRIASSIAGLWMTFEGNFSGKNYPGTRDKFADLMMGRNPWGINHHFGMDRTDWLRTGGVQNPYLKFSSGYGPLSLPLIIGLFLTSAYVGFRQLWSGRDRSMFSVWTIFLISLVVLNQTQPWIQSGSFILFLSGIATAYIWSVELRLGQQSFENPLPHH